MDICYKDEAICNKIEGIGEDFTNALDTIKFENGDAILSKVCHLEKDVDDLEKKTCCVSEQIGVNSDGETIFECLEEIKETTFNNAVGLKKIYVN
jgi:hypothetical protein